MDRVEVSNYTSDVFTTVKCRISKYNRTTFVLNSEFALKYDILESNNITCFGEVKSSHGNEYKRVGSKQMDKPIEFMQQHPHYYNNMAKYCNHPKVLEFPIKAVSYIF